MVEPNSGSDRSKEKSEKKGATAPAGAPVVKKATPPPKKKKPKHLKRYVSFLYPMHPPDVISAIALHSIRKLARAVEAGDAEAAGELRRENESWKSHKAVRMTKWELACKALAGPKWEKAKFDQLCTEGNKSKAEFLKVRHRRCSLNLCFRPLIPSTC